MLNERSAAVWSAAYRGVSPICHGLGIGVDDETNVSLDYKEGDNAFTGKINRVTINVN